MHHNYCCVNIFHCCIAFVTELYSHVEIDDYMLIMLLKMNKYLTAAFYNY